MVVILRPSGCGDIIGVAGVLRRGILLVVEFAELNRGLGVDALLNMVLALE